jgi:hypothetical protein
LSSFSGPSLPNDHLFGESVILARPPDSGTSWSPNTRNRPAST